MLKWWWLACTSIAVGGCNLVAGLPDFADGAGGSGGGGSDGAGGGEGGVGGASTWVIQLESPYSEISAIARRPMSTVAVGQFEDELTMGAAVAEQAGRHLFAADVDPLGNVTRLLTWPAQSATVVDVAARDDTVALIGQAGESWPVSHCPGATSELSFIAIVNAAGELRCSINSALSGGATSQVNAIAADGEGYVVGGEFSGTVSFGGEARTALDNATEPDATSDGIAVFYDDMSHFASVIQFSGTGPQSVQDVSVGSDGGYIVGNMTSTLVLSDNIVRVSANGPAGDSFLARFVAPSNAVAAMSFAGGKDGDIRVTRVAATTDGVVVAGSYDGVFSMFPSADANEDSNNLFVIAYDSDLEFRWSYLLSGTSSKEIGGLQLDGSGNVLLTGSFDGILDDTKHRYSYSAPTRVAFALRLDPVDGVPKSASIINGTLVRTRGILGAGGNTFVLGGNFSGSLQIGEPPIQSDTPNGFLARLAEQPLDQGP